MALNKEIMLPSDLSTVTPGVGIKGYNYAIVRNFMYVFGGGTSEYGVPNNQKIYIYDIITDAWITVDDPKMPTNLMGAATCVYDGEVYFFGGLNVTNIVKYNPISKLWTTIKLCNIDTITPSSYLFASKPFIIGDKAYFQGCTPVGDSSHLNSEVRMGIYSFTDNTFVINASPLPANIFHMNLYKDAENHDRISVLQYDISTQSLSLNEYDYPNKIVDITDGYKRVIGGYTPVICANIEGENQFVSARMENNSLVVEMRKYKDITGNETEEDIIEIVPRQQVKNISMSIGSINSASNTNDVGDLYIPVTFEKNGETVLGVMAVYQPEYIINSEQPIVTTVLNELTGIRDIIGCNIYGTEPEHTYLRFAFSCNDSPFKVYNAATMQWETIIDTVKNYIISNGDGMTKGQVEILTRNEWKKLIGDTGAAVKINVLVCLMSEDEDYTPTISEIRFKVIK